MKKFIFLIFISLFTEILFSEVIILKDESKIIGKIIKMDEDSYTVIGDYGELVIDKDDIVNVFQTEEDYQEYLNKLKEITNVNNDKKESIINKNEEPWKRHFFDLCIIGGLSMFIDPEYMQQTSFGGLIGSSFGYQYAFTDKFAFGPGASGFGSIVYHNYTVLSNGIERTIDEVSGNLSGGALMFTFMFGDLRYKKIAFLLDVGGGWEGAVKFGLYYKGFVFKIGYNLTFFIYGQNITIDFGYKFNWAGKKKTKK